MMGRRRAGAGSGTRAGARERPGTAKQRRDVPLAMGLQLLQDPQLTLREQVHCILPCSPRLLTATTPCPTERHSFGPCNPTPHSKLLI